MDYSTLIPEEQRLSRVPLTALYEALKQVKDGRKKRGCRYSLALLLTLLLLARLAGETDIRAAAQWIRLRKGWISEHLHLTRASLPCAGTYGYALDGENRCARTAGGGGGLSHALGSGGAL